MGALCCFFVPLAEVGSANASSPDASFCKKPPENAYFNLLSASTDGRFYMMPTVPAVIFMAHSFLSKWLCSRVGRAAVTFSCSLTVCLKICMWC